MRDKAYLGDAVYAEFDRQCGIITLSQCDPEGECIELVLEPEVVQALTEYVVQFAKVTRHEASLRR